MERDAKRNPPQPSVRRLPGYLRFLRQLRQDGGKQVSCTQIAGELRLDSTQVRKDLALTGIAGKPRIGYPLDALIAAIEKFLGWDTRLDAFLVGAGSLGHALMGYENFVRHGMEIVAAFDVDPDKVGREVMGRRIYALGELPGLARTMGVSLGILTVPAPAAQAAADVLVAGGITGIWNFAPARLSLPESVLVENVELASSLAILTLYMSGTAAAKAKARHDAVSVPPA